MAHLSSFLPFLLHTEIVATVAALADNPSPLSVRTGPSGSVISDLQHSKPTIFKNRSWCNVDFIADASTNSTAKNAEDLDDGDCTDNPSYVDNTLRPALCTIESTACSSW